MTDYKALCAELVAAIDASVPYATPLLDRARAALAHSESEGPSDEELYDLWDQEACYFNLYEEARDFARAVLARWG
jgi:hypothetical protein